MNQPISTPSNPNLEPVDTGGCDGDCAGCKCATPYGEPDKEAVDPFVQNFDQNTNEPETEVSKAFNVIRAALAANPSYAWSWHCNIAMSFVDSGGDSVTGNRGAVRFMQSAFGVDTSNGPEYKALQKLWGKRSDSKPAVLTQTPPVRHALCANLTDLPLEYQLKRGLSTIQISPLLWQTPVFLSDRSVCEEDETKRQFIPYIVLHNTRDNTFFTYSRGKGGAENRLHSNLSIGLGGHIDDVPPEGLDLKSWCVQEARRELMEEVGLTQIVDLDFCSLLCDDTNSVGRVHIGLLAVVDVKPSMLEKSEADVIEHGSWLTLDELRASTRLENWSVAALGELLARQFD